MSKRNRTVPAIKSPSTPPYRGAAFDLLPNVRAEFEKQKLTILAKSIGLNDPLVDHDAAIELCMRVCFPPLGKHGRPKGTTKKWGVFSMLRFVARVEAIKRERNCTDRTAVYRLMKDRKDHVPKRLALGRSETSSERAINSVATRLQETRCKLRTLFPQFDDPDWQHVAFNFAMKVRHD